jgi:hypothetical protein
MTIQEVLNQIHIKYEFNVEYFDMANEDQKVRLALVNDKINMWENEDGILWRELFVSVQDRFTDEATYPVPDLILPANRIVSDGNYFEYISPELLQEQEKMSPFQKMFTITGGDTEKVINVPADRANEEFRFYYYKKARTYVTGEETEPIEMADPYFIIYAVVAELFLDDGDTEKSSVATQIATQKLEGMKSKNSAVPVFVDTKQPDYQFKGFGN